jgi:hypothetical protein
MGCGCSKPQYVDITNPVGTDFDLRSLHSGDLILFSRPKLMDKKRFFKPCKWTDVGMVVHLPTLYPNHGLMLFESQNRFSDGLVDILSNTVPTSGTRLVDLHSRINDSEFQEIAARYWETRSLDTELRFNEQLLHNALMDHSNSAFDRRAILIRFDPSIPEPGVKRIASVLQQLNIIDPDHNLDKFLKHRLSKGSSGCVQGQYSELNYIRHV